MSERAPSGDDPCWVPAVAADGDLGVVVEHDVDAVPGIGGVVWHLPPSRDLNVNLVRLEPDQRIGEHINDDVDVLMVVRAGDGEMAVDGIRHQIVSGSVAHVRHGAARSISAGPAGLTYLSVHRRRGSLTIRTGD